MKSSDKYQDDRSMESHALKIAFRHAGSQYPRSSVADLVSYMKYFAPVLYSRRYCKAICFQWW